MKRHRHPQSDPCFVAPHPSLLRKMRKAVKSLRDAADPTIATRVGISTPRRPGFDDGMIFPPDAFPLGTPLRTIRSAAADRSLRGDIHIIVVLVEFSDRTLSRATSHFEDLFFSRGKLTNGSVADYFDEVSGGLISITGQIAGPFRLPKTIKTYANKDAGRTLTAPNARTMARDTVLAAQSSVDFSPFDNDGNGFVDAFIVVHAGSGAEQTGNLDSDIWSHKWIIEGQPITANGTKIFAYLTVPEDARIGVCCHELGHLVFGWPDLYDVDDTSEGVGSWCLMGAGSWNGQGLGSGAVAGDVPAHPSAWCKQTQGWVNVTAPTTNGPATLDDVKSVSKPILRLWQNGDTTSQEYFLAEFRAKKGFDRGLPGEGLLVWHIDDDIDSNRDENHYKVALVQADGKRDLERSKNRGDASDPYPGSRNVRKLDKSTTPSTRSYAGIDTSVSLTQISVSGGKAKATLKVRS